MVTQNRAIKKNFNSTHNLAPLFESKSELNSKKNKVKSIKPKRIFSPLRYAGGKTKAANIITEYLPQNITELASPFFGGGSFEIACANSGIKIYGYELFDLLVNYWKFQINKPVKLAETLLSLKPTAEEYKRIKEILKLHWENKTLIQDKLILAAYYWFNHNLSYGPGFLGWMSKIYQNKNKYFSSVERVKNFSYKNKISIQNLSFEKSIHKHKQTFLYCDPPYYLEGDSKMFKGIYPQRNFPVHHNNFNHLLLRKLLGNHKGGFICSYNDCDYIRELYNDFKIVKVTWQYSLGQGETRIGKNRLRDSSKHIKKSHEILIIG